MYSEHNERIKYVYGNYCWWSWFRYWYLDSCNLVTMLLIDKGYFDYDFEKFGILEQGKDWADTVRSDEEMDEIMKGFGFGRRTKKPETLEEIQSHILKQESYGS